MKHRFVIDGRQLTGQIGGVQRYISEILKELDQIAELGEYEVLVPKNSDPKLSYSNIRIKKYGLFSGLLWEQISLPIYILKNKAYGIYPCTVCPMLRPKGITVIHDVMIKIIPEVKKTVPLIPRFLLEMNYRAGAKHSNRVVTVSEHSKQDIISTYHIPDSKISVIGNAWQHMNDIEEDDGWKERFPQLNEGEYFFTLSANRIQKNFKWIYEVAKRNPERIFAIAGTCEEWQKQIEYDAPNIIHLGFVSNEEVKSLMKNAKAFLFPSFYEGFGIPPMEALACGAKIAIAKASCLPEIYGNSAYYFDPFDYDIDIDALLETEVAPPSEVLSRFGWDISAERLNALCHNLDEE